MGIFGGIAWMAMIIFSWVRSARLNRQSRSAPISILSFTALAVGIGYFVVALTQYLNDNLEASLPIWFLVGWVGIQAYQLKKHREQVAGFLARDRNGSALMLPHP